MKRGFFYTLTNAATTYQECRILTKFYIFYLFYNECQNNTMYTQYGYDVLQTMYVPLRRLSFAAKCYMYSYRVIEKDGRDLKPL